MATLPRSSPVFPFAPWLDPRQVPPNCPSWRLLFLPAGGGAAGTTLHPHAGSSPQKDPSAPPTQLQPTLLGIGQCSFKNNSMAGYLRVEMESGRPCGVGRGRVFLLKAWPEDGKGITSNGSDAQAVQLSMKPFSCPSLRSSFQSGTLFMSRRRREEGRITCLAPSWKPSPSQLGAPYSTPLGGPRPRAPPCGHNGAAPTAGMPSHGC